MSSVVKTPIDSVTRAFTEDVIKVDAIEKEGNAKTSLLF